MSEISPLVRAHELRYDVGTSTILGPLDLTVERGELVGVIGPNGAGKTTLLRLIAGLREASTGTLELEGSPLQRLTQRERARRLAYVPQRAELGFPLSVLDLVLLGDLRDNGLFYDRAELAERGMRALQRVELASFADREADTLSGGEFQRLLIARALMQDSPLLLLDEPTSALDLHHQSQVGRILREEHTRGRTIVAVLHDLNLAARLCSRLVLLVSGLVRASGPASEVLCSTALDEAYGPHLHRVTLEGDATPLLFPKL